MKRFDSRIDFRAITVAIVLILTLVIAFVINIEKENNLVVDLNNDIALDNSDAKIDWSKYQTVDVELSESFTVSQSGTYHLTGALSDGMVSVDAGVNDVRLLLDNISLNHSSGPAIACYSAKNLVIELVGENYIGDGVTYDSSLDEDMNGAIYSKADLIFQGEGSLWLTSNFQDAIVGKDDVKFNGGHYIINAADDGIRGKNSVYVMDGEFTINSVGDGIISTNSIDRDKGFVLIENGRFYIDVGDDGIRADHKLRIDGGIINISRSYEGLEAQVIAINGGEISVNANDDGINAGNKSSDAQVDTSCVLSVNDGSVYINSSGDGVDSNGYIYFNGGTTIIDGPTNDNNGALDSGAGITMNGGIVIAVGSNGMAETLGDASKVYNINVFFSSQVNANSRIDIRDSNNDVILSHVSAKPFRYLAAGSSTFSLGGAYTIYLNDQKVQDFVISGISTIIGNNHNIFNNGFRR